MLDIACVIQLKNDLVAIVDKRARLVESAIPVAIKLSPNQPVEQVVRISHLLLLDVRNIEVSHADQAVAIVVLVDGVTGASKTRARGTVAHREVSFASATRTKTVMQKPKN
ncbi:hypothetical protein DTL42_17890 [Bremerella cremea]|uniref:Uncharacterized protein n=1 Tax=Bremerella cremea TaxID=1031537 RepID=A0A368KRI9_9BACT|nr:hypothetical protein [Bremerella cremea]RCS44183.1 hypothetical protein DTL42_17890 [Bremerella cremea]